MYCLKIVLVTLMISWLFGCAAFDGDPDTTIGNTTIGNNQVDIDLNDGKLFGSEKAYLIGISAAQFAVYKKPAIGESVKSKLLKGEQKITDFQKKYPPDKSAQIVVDFLNSQCGFWCNTVAGQQYVGQYINLVAEMADEFSPNLLIAPSEIIEQLIQQIELVEASAQ